MPAADTAGGFVVSALGPLAAQRDGAALDLGGTKQRLLLALLLIGADHVVSTDSLIDGLWGEDPPATARKALQMHVSNLRRAVGDDFPLRTAPGGYIVQSATLEYDVTDFDAAVTKATAMIRTDAAAASRLLSSALAAWNGPAFADLEDEDAIRPEIARLGELRLAALERRIDADLRLGRHGEVVSELETLTLDHPFHERFREQQMFALYRSGRQTDALRAYDRLRSELVEQLGIEPSPALQTLRDQILQHASELDPEDDTATQQFAFLATDLEDSTALWEADPEAMQQALTRHDALLDEAVAANAGSVFKGTGDGIYAVFSAATDAIQAAVDAQIALADEPWRTSNPLKVRMAVDEGSAAERDGDYFGPVLNRVSRIMSSGHGAQLLVPAALASQAPLPIRDLGTADYKGIGRVEVAQIDIPDLPHDFPPLQTDRAPKTTVREGFGRAIRGYELREKLGVGAYGIVFRAYQASIGREVAIKVIRPELANRTDFVKRFEAEAQYVAQLEHPHIVPLYDYWRDPDGAYLVMQMLRGGSLADSLTRSLWRPPAALNLLEQIGVALDYAHRQGVVHRDLKPANVLLDADGNAFLSDFGIAVQHVEAVGVPIESSVAYVSPEELAGQPVGVAADMYGLTLLAYEILTGDRPELGGQPKAVALQRPELPPAIDRVLERGAHPDPAQRYARVADFLRDLRQAFGADAAVAPTDGPPVPVRNPFKGLQAFKETDAQDFYGRDELVTELVDHVARHRLTAVVGPSGCGKSSVVRAGLLPAVRRGALDTPGDALITEMYPGSYPFEELESALLRVAVSPSGPSLSDLLGDERGLLRVSKQILPDDDSELVLVIDQFEELFALTHDEAARKHFLASLVEVINDERSRVRVVVTLRADYFDRPLEDPEFGALLGNSVVPVAMPRDHELAAAIAQPAKSAGLEFEPGLIPRIVRDVADEPGALPLMQYALTALVDQSDDHLLTAASYEAVGGVSGALATRAEEIYEGMAGTIRDAVPEVFLRLVRVDEHSDDTRRRARRAELDGLGFPDHVIESVIAAYGSFRLLSFDHDPVTRGQTVEVAHEALIREWPRFGEWISERRESLLLEQRLASATDEWERGGRSTDLLIAGGRLEQFENWSAAHDVPLPEPEREFLSDSRRNADQAERQRVSRRRRVTTLVGVLAALACVAAAVALVQRNQANEKADEAETQKELAENAAAEADSLRAEAEDATAEAESQKELAEDAAAEADSQKVLAEDAATEADSLRVEAVRRELAESARRLAVTAEATAGDDAELATLLAVEAVRRAERSGFAVPELMQSLFTATNADRVAARLPTSGRYSNASLVSAAPDGGRFAAVFDVDSTGSKVAQVLDMSDDESATTLDVSEPTSVAWHDTRPEVMIADADGVLWLADPDTGAARRSIDTGADYAQVDQYVADWVVYTVKDDDPSVPKDVIVADAATGEVVLSWPRSWATISPSGRFVLVEGPEVVRVYEVESRRDLGPVGNYETGHRFDWVAGEDALWWTPRGDGVTRVAVPSLEKTQIPTGTSIATMHRVKASPDGRWLAVGDLSGNILIFDAVSLEVAGELTSQAPIVLQLEWIPGVGIVSWHADPRQELVVWDLGGEPAARESYWADSLRYAAHHAPLPSGDLMISAFNPDDINISRLEVWTSTGLVEPAEQPDGGDERRAFTSNQPLVASSKPGFAGITVFDVVSGDTVLDLPTDTTVPLALSPDGSTLIATSSAKQLFPGAPAPPRVAAIDVATGAELWSLPGVLMDPLPWTSMMPVAFVETGDVVVLTTGGQGSERYDGPRDLIALQLRTGAEIARYALPGVDPNVVASPSGSLLATADSGGRITVLDVARLLSGADATVGSTILTSQANPLGMAFNEDETELLLPSGTFSDELLAMSVGSEMTPQWSIDISIYTNDDGTKRPLPVSRPIVRDGLAWFVMWRKPSILGPALEGRTFGLVGIPTDPVTYAEWAATQVSRPFSEAECQQHLGGSCADEVTAS